MVKIINKQSTSTPNYDKRLFKSSIISGCGEGSGIVYSDWQTDGLTVSKGLANCWIDIILLYSESSGPGKVFN